VNPNVDRFIILADESANWEIAGLRQLDRLVLALNEFAKSAIGESKIDIIVLWRPDISGEQRWQPQPPKLTHCRFVERFDASPGDERLLNTRLLVKRSGLEQFVRDSVPLDLDQRFVNESTLWQELWGTFEGDCRRALPQNGSWRYVSEPGDIPRSEQWLLLGSGKSRDGFVSRYLNRPVSRAVSQFLLKTPMTPNLWTLLITLFPIVGFLFLIRGDYFGFVAGAALYQIHSILDGCDGEIARAKYLDSEKGPGFDALGDLIALLLFSLGLGVGLFRAADAASFSRWVFLGEGVLCFLLIASRLGPHAFDLLRRGPVAVASSEHDESLRHSGGWVFGAQLTSMAFELTKRDIVFLAFLVLAALGLAQWILHLLFVYAVATTILLRHGRVTRPDRGPTFV
jgi:phosphatidylglycerophosphate synthase